MAIGNQNGHCVGTDFFEDVFKNIKKHSYIKLHEQ